MKENIFRKDEKVMTPTGGNDINRAASPAVEKKNPYEKMLDEAGPVRAAHIPGWGADAETGKGTTYPRDGNFVAKGSPTSAYPKDGNFVSKGSDPGKYKKG